jgi:hypothetical protein
MIFVREISHMQTTDIEIPCEITMKGLDVTFLIDLLESSPRDHRDSIFLLVGLVGTGGTTGVTIAPSNS